MGDFEHKRVNGSVEHLVGEFQHPEFRGVGGIDWSMGDWQTAARLNDIGEFKDDRDAGAMGAVDAMLTFDMNVSYVGFEHWALSVGGTNLFNEDPPFSEADFMGYDQTTHSAQGLLYRVRPVIASDPVNGGQKGDIKSPFAYFPWLPTLQ